jgi:tRNA(Ile)-lysidine synthetase-like protein
MIERKFGLIESLKKYLEKFSISDAVGIACSGGKDSMSLLKAFSLVYEPQKIYCFHCDHGWREDSFQAVEFLENYSKEISVKFEFKELELTNYDEASAREARYKSLEEMCLSNSVQNLFLAHNLNDDVETILFRVFRGTSTKGLMGIPESRELDSGIRIHRPLLSISRDLIEDFMETYSMKFIDDPSNKDIIYARNRIRHMILTEAEEINSKSVENIKKLSELISEEQEYFDIFIESCFNELGELPWALDEFRNYHKAIQRKIFEKNFTSSIAFCDEFLKAVEIGGFHKINFEKDKFFVIRQKTINLERT